MNISGRFIKTILLIPAIVLSACAVYAETYLFQDHGLPDDARLDNLISLMTLEEKLDNLSPMLPGVPRLGVHGTRIVEGLHGLAWSGPANWAVKGKWEAPTTTFPQAIGLAQLWDPELLKQIADWEAYEARYLAQNSEFRTRGHIGVGAHA